MALRSKNVTRRLVVEKVDVLLARIDDDLPARDVVRGQIFCRAVERKYRTAGIGHLLDQRQRLAQRRAATDDQARHFASRRRCDPWNIALRVDRDLREDHFIGRVAQRFDLDVFAEFLDVGEAGKRHQGLSLAYYLDARPELAELFAPPFG